MTSPTSGQNYFVDRWRKLAFKLRIKGDAKLVLLALVELYAGHKDGSNCYPSIDSLVWHTELSRRTVQRALDLLEERSIVTRIQCVGTSNLYEFGDADKLESAIPERPARQARVSQGHPRQADTSVTLTPLSGQADTPPVSQGHPPCVSVTPYHSQGTPSLNTPNEQAAATHEGERTHEPREAAAAAPKGQDLNLDHDQPKQAAAASREPAQTSTAAPQRVASAGEGDGLAGWLVGELKARKAELVRTDASATPAQVKVCVAAVVALADGDESEARQYLQDRLAYYTLRGEGRPKSLSTLLGFLADRGDFEKWASAPPAAPAPKKVKNQFARDPDDVPRPPVKPNPEGARSIAAMFGVVLPADRIGTTRNGEGVNHEN
jgi:hypothetical protein